MDSVWFGRLRTRKDNDIKVFIRPLEDGESLPQLLGYDGDDEMSDNEMDARDKTYRPPLRIAKERDVKTSSSATLLSLGFSDPALDAARDAIRAQETLEEEAWRRARQCRVILRRLIMKGDVVEAARVANQPTPTPPNSDIEGQLLLLTPPGSPAAGMD